MKGKKTVIVIGILLLVSAFIPISQAAQTEPSMIADIYITFGLLVLILIILGIAFYSYVKEQEAKQKKAKRKKRKVKKAVTTEKTYTSNNIELVELNRRKRKIQW